MTYNVLQIIATFVLLFFLPGFTLVQALFPARRELDEEFDLLYRIVLAIGLSFTITSFTGFVLGMITDPSTGKGMFKQPYITITILLISFVFFLIGLYRGAYPRLFYGKKTIAIDKRKKAEIYMKMARWRELKLEKRRLEERLTTAVDRAERLYYKRKLHRLNSELEKLSTELKQLK